MDTKLSGMAAHKLGNVTQEVPPMARMLTTTVHTPRLQRLAAFALVAALAFAAGSVFGRAGWPLVVGSRGAAPTTRAAAWVDPTNPIRTAASSAYDGRAPQSARAAGAPNSDTPITSAGSSAYDGKPYRSAHAAVSSSSNAPITSASSSAYDGKPYKAPRAAVASRNDTPITSAGSSAYDGQSGNRISLRTQRPHVPNPITSAGSSAYQPRH